MAKGNFTQRVLLDGSTTAAVTGAWVPLDYQNFSNMTIQSIVGTVASGDTVYIEVTNDIPYIDGVAQTITCISTVSAFTDAFNTITYGPVVAIRARKTGTAGAARVVGVFG